MTTPDRPCAPGPVPRLRGRLLRTAVVSVLACLSLSSGCDAPSPAAPEPTRSPSPSRPDSRALAASIEKAITSGSVALDTIEAVLVSVDGRTVIEHYRNDRLPTAVVDTWSVTKSVTSALIGIAIGDGVLEGLDQTLAELLPRYRSSMSAELAGVTLRQLLDMSAGFGDDRFNSQLGEQMFEHDGDTVAYILRRGLENSPR